MSQTQKNELKVRYKYIHFVKVGDTGKTTQWSCRNNTAWDDCHTVNEVGVVKWCPTWRQYCLYSESAMFSAGCLNDISDFIKQLMDRRKK